MIDVFVAPPGPQNQKYIETKQTGYAGDLNRKSGVE